MSVGEMIAREIAKADPRERTTLSRNEIEELAEVFVSDRVKPEYACGSSVTAFVRLSKKIFRDPLEPELFRKLVKSKAQTIRSSINWRRVNDGIDAAGYVRSKEDYPCKRFCVAESIEEIKILGSLQVLRRSHYRPEDIIGIIEDEADARNYAFEIDDEGCWIVDYT